MGIWGIGVLYLYVKTIERAHSPKHMWEKIKLSNNYASALQQVRLLDSLFVYRLGWVLNLTFLFLVFWFLALVSVLD